MTKEQIKFCIDNQEAIFNQIEQRLENRYEELNMPDTISSENIKGIYDEYNKYCSDIFNEYHIDLDSFKVLMATMNEEKGNRVLILGREAESQLLKDIIDIYGDDAYGILRCNSYNFEMTEIDSILTGDDSEKYKKFYTKVLNEKCRRAQDLESLSDILLSTKPEYVNQQVIESFLEGPNRIITESEIKQFIETAPTPIIRDGEALKLLVDRAESVSDKEILEEIPKELFDEDFSKRLLEKASSSSFSKVFNEVPEEVKSKEIWELAIEKDSEFIYFLPDTKIEESMTDEEYSKWCEKLIINVVKNDLVNINTIFGRLNDNIKTKELYIEGAKLVQPDNVEDFLKQIPEENRSREMYEILLQKSVDIIREIPNETFEKELSQEKYEDWVDRILVQKISNITDLDNLYSNMPRQRMTEKVWNALFNRCNEIGADKSKLKLIKVPIKNITIDMCELALEEIGLDQVSFIPSIDRKLDTIDNDELKKEYAEWQDSLSEQQKQEFRKWYEEKIIDIIKDKKINLFTNRFSEENSRIEIPTEAITTNMIMTYLQQGGPGKLGHIPVPNENTSYNEQYKDIILTAINMLPEKSYSDTLDGEQSFLNNWDIINIIPEEYRTHEVLLEAVKKHPKYLKYVDLDNETSIDFLQIAYANKLKTMGRTELSNEEIGIMKEFAKNNSNLFSTLELEILSPEIVKTIDKSSLERMARYSNVQKSIIQLSKNKDALITFSYALENLKQDKLFIEPLIEQLSTTIMSQVTSRHNTEKQEYESIANEFLKLASSRIQNNSIPLSEEERVIISYLALNPKEAKKINSYDDILNFEIKKNAELDQTMSSQNVTLIDAKNAYFERVVGMDYDSVAELVRKYGNDPEHLLEKYNGKEFENDKEITEKQSLETIIKLKSIIEENDLNAIKKEYQQTINAEVGAKDFQRYKAIIELDSTLKRAYGRDVTEKINDHSKENVTESIEHTQEGQEYVVRKVHGQFNRMVSVMGAYKTNNTEGDMYDRWNTSDMAENHALCFSYINEENPATAMNDGKKRIVVSIDGINAEALTALAPYDLRSKSMENTTITQNQQRFYTADNLPNQARDTYSEAVVEIQDVSEGVEKFKKIQIASIVCFEEVDKESIQASIELSQKLGKTVPIELIDRRELAYEQKAKIDNLLNEFKSGEKLQPELVEQIVTRFNNVKNAHFKSDLSKKLVGDKNTDAPFNKTHLNRMIEECIDAVEQRIERGEVQEGVEAIKQIKQIIKNERKKEPLMETMYEKHLMAGIDLNIDYRLDELQRTYEKPEISADNRNESLEVLFNNQQPNSKTFEIIYGKNTVIPKQIRFSKLRDCVDVGEIQSIAEDVHKDGYYRENKSYSEEHITRVAIFSNAIANIEGADLKTKKLLGEAVKYYSSGMQMDNEAEQHQEYSAKIAGKELSGKYTEQDIGIVQAAIELQNAKCSNEAQEREKLSNLCSKYKVDINEARRVHDISTYMHDAVTLDKSRFIVKPDIPYAERFSYEDLKTDTAQILVKSSYCMQDELATRHLERMSKVADIDYQAEKDVIIDELSTLDITGTKMNIYDESIIESPIVQEAHFKLKYSEFDDPVRLGRELENIPNSTRIMEKPEASTPVLTEQPRREQEVNVVEQPREGKVVSMPAFTEQQNERKVVSIPVLTEKQDERKVVGIPLFTEQQIGKATINTPTMKKEIAQARINRDEQIIRQMIGERETLE